MHALRVALAAMQKRLLHTQLTDEGFCGSAAGSPCRHEGDVAAAPDAFTADAFGAVGAGGNALGHEEGQALPGFKIPSNRPGQRNNSKDPAAEMIPLMQFSGQPQANTQHPPHSDAPTDLRDLFLQDNRLSTIYSN